MKSRFLDMLLEMLGASMLENMSIDKDKVKVI